MRATFLFAAIFALLVSGAASAAEIRLLSTQAVEKSFGDLIPMFEKATGNKVTALFTGTLDAHKRIAAGENYDLLVMASDGIDAHLKDGKLAPGARADLASSGVALGVKAGAPKPDIHSTEALKKTLLAAKSIGYSTGPSGDYVVTLFQRLGIAEQLKPKLTQTPTGVFVGDILASGAVEIGFQQVSELSGYPGVTFVGPLPADVQQITTFSGGILAKAKEPEAAKALLRFLSAPAAAPVYRRHGMEPSQSPRRGL